MHHADKVCINVPKVFDWIRSRLEVPTIVFDKLSFKECDHFDCDWKMNDPCKLLNKRRAIIECLLTDKKGNVLDPNKKDSFICTAQIQQDKEITVKLKSGETVTLKKVLVVVQGFIVIEVLNSFGFTICISNPIPFKVVETFLLCAPEGTEAECEVTFFQCEADLICSQRGCFEELNLSIVICVDVQTTADVKLELEAEECEKREDFLPLELVECPNDIIPQCPEVFPVKKKFLKNV
ncbi:hypothetical protein [Bacillus sp. FJAT-47783]|uniref:hypothetical protein n=1 Tax=Bacillus sp. FJAT-47783 TaxID=2922712 RepID=UPI001FAB396C|nr:hypothetical protein [Bacillus sp. FJAT-47783]